jgi:hypothetical protein
LLDLRVLAALAARHHAVVVDQADGCEAEAAALDRDAAGLREQVVALRDPHDEGVHR